MQPSRPENAIHKSTLNRLLIEIVDQPYLAHHLGFKGGTCASMLGYLDRFSVDLDFDLLSGDDQETVRVEFLKVFEYLGFAVMRELEKGNFFQLRYPSQPGKRNTLKVSASNLIIKANQYKVQYFSDIDRLMMSQTIETMFANKLVAVTDRYKMHKTIAGRDIYDIHHFFVHGFSYHAPVIQERTGLEPRIYLEQLIAFIQNHVTATVIHEDLNSLLSNQQFQRIRKVLIPETISILRTECERLNSIVL
jgi:predicted nucleotidyltransferase component of viral defense system